MPFETQSASIETSSLFARKRKKERNNFDEKNSSPMLFACGIHRSRSIRTSSELLCRKTSTVSRLQLDHTTKHESCHLLLLICMSFDKQSAPTETRSLCARKGKKKNIFTKRIFLANVGAGRNRRLRSMCISSELLR
jgi:hypothetical protein